MSKFFNLISTHFEWILHFFKLLGFNSELLEKQRSSGLIHYYYSCNSDDSVQDCSICLSKIQQREQVTKLRCNHLFHRACLDRWLGSGAGRWTCPLCSKKALAAGDHGAQILELRFVSSTSLRSSDDRDSFWLR
ncbi:E3 ubiquitin-protein ligase RNF12 [Linum perenne]